MMTRKEFIFDEKKFIAHLAQFVRPAPTVRFDYKNDLEVVLIKMLIEKLGCPEKVAHLLSTSENHVSLILRLAETDKFTSRQSEIRTGKDSPIGG